MKNINLLLLFFVLVSVEVFSSSIPVLAQIFTKIQLANDPPTRQPPPPPEGGDDTATRSEFCENTQRTVQPLMRRTDGVFSGLTLRERPTFWFYVPYQSDIVTKGKFVLEDEEGNLEFSQFFKLPKTPGFVSFSIPMTAKPLVKNKQYRWSFTLYCQLITSSEPKSVVREGWIQRVDLDSLETQLRTAKPIERIAIYIDKKIWYDAASDSANNREFPEAWVKLLEAVGLQDLKQETIGGEVVLIEKPRE